MQVAPALPGLTEDATVKTQPAQEAQADLVDTDGVVELGPNGVCTWRLDRIASICSNESTTLNVSINMKDGAVNMTCAHGPSAADDEPMPDRLESLVADGLDHSSIYFLAWIARNDLSMWLAATFSLLMQIYLPILLLDGLPADYSFENGITKPEFDWTQNQSDMWDLMLCTRRSNDTKAMAAVLLLMIVVCTLRDSWQHGNLIVSITELFPGRRSSNIALLVCSTLETFVYLLVMISTYSLFASNPAISEMLLNSIALIFLVDIDNMVGRVMRQIRHATISESIRQFSRDFQACKADPSTLWKPFEIALELQDAPLTGLPGPWRYLIGFPLVLGLSAEARGKVGCWRMLGYYLIGFLRMAVQLACIAIVFLPSYCFCGEDIDDSSAPAPAPAPAMAPAPAPAPGQ